MLLIGSEILFCGASRAAGNAQQKKQQEQEQLLPRCLYCGGTMIENGSDGRSEGELSSKMTVAVGG
jgi:hypothetical protein